MANTRISNLTASAANLASTDLAPVVQTAGVGPVKMTGLQLAGGLLGSAAFNGATVTTSQPVLNLSQTWNAGAVTFTGLKFNATDTASASGSLLLDLQVGGNSRSTLQKTGAQTWNVYLSDNTTNVGQIQYSTPGGYAGILLYSDLGVSNRVNLRYATSNPAIFGIGFNAAYTGNPTFAVTSTGNAILSSAAAFGWNSDVLSAGSQDLFLTRAAAATLQLGAADAAAPVAQTLQVQSVVAGTSNTAGANWTLKGSRGTGTGAGGSIIFQVAPAGSSGTAQNAYATALTIAGDRTITTTGNAVFGNSSASQIDFIGTSGNCIASVTNSAGTGQVDGFVARNTSVFGFSSSVNPLGTVDVRLYRDSAGTLALRNGANAQTFNVYNTYTDASNYERLRIVAQSANSVIIGTQKAGTGTARALELQTDGTTRLTFDAAPSGSNPLATFTSNPGAGAALTVRITNTATSSSGGGSSLFLVSDSGSALASGDRIGSFSFGGSSASGNIRAAALVGAFANQAWVDGSAYGSRIQFETTANNATSRTVRLILGNSGILTFGATEANTVPALKPSSTTLQVRLGDDSAAATLEALSLKTGAPSGGTSGTWKLGVRVAATTTLDTTQYIEVDIGGTLYKLAVVTS